MTPNGEKYEGLAFQKGSCGVSIIRSGEAMEQGLRDCCRSIRIGKILIQVKLDLTRGGGDDLIDSGSVWAR